MTYEQASIFAILGGLMLAFVWGIWRYEVVAFAGLLLAVALGVVPIDKAFLGFGNPTVVTVAAVLIISRALANSGMIDHVVRSIAPTTGRTTLHVAVLVGMAALLSAFMNNLVALALLLLVALQSAAPLEALIVLVGTPLILWFWPI